MKKYFSVLLAVMVTSSLLAQTPPPTTNTTAAKRAAARKAAAEVRSTPLVPGAASVIASNVNVRGRAGLIGEVLTKVSQGDTVTVIEEIKLKRSKSDEPSAWAKINLPPGAHVWVSAHFIDEATKTVKPRKLNLRGGPGENYSIIGSLEKGAVVKEIQTRGAWVEIEPPAGAYAFMAAQYLNQEPPAAPVPEPTPEPAPVATTVPEPTPIATTTTETPIVPTTPPATLPEITPEPEPEPEPSDEPPPPRIVQREGIVKGTVSIQAPTRFALVSTDTGRTINYLYTTSTNLDLSRYKGLHIVVTGEEGLDRRWRNTPVITIQRILVLE
jgi:uncharacterized protein YgiM (DUF1202 family)